MARASRSGCECPYPAPAFEGSLVEVARYGGNREQAVTARLLERAAGITSDPAAAANLVLETRVEVLPSTLFLVV